MYLIKFSDNSFSLEESKEGFEDAIELSNDIYKELKTKIDSRISLKVKNILGNTFEEIFEEYEINNIRPINPTEMLAKQIASLKVENREKDILLKKLAKEICSLKIEIKQIGGANNA